MFFLSLNYSACLLIQFSIKFIYVRKDNVWGLLGMERPEMRIVRRRRDDSTLDEDSHQQKIVANGNDLFNGVNGNGNGSIRQAKMPPKSQQPEKPPGRKLVTYFIILLILASAICILVYINNTVSSSKLTLSDRHWALGLNQTIGGTEADISTNVTNGAKTPLNGTIDLYMVSSTDGSNWAPFNFTDALVSISYSGVHGIVTAPGHLRFPTDANAVFTFPVNNTLLTFHIVFSTGLAPAMYKIDLTVKQVS